MKAIVEGLDNVSGQKPKAGTRMRNKHVPCDRCKGKCMFTANMDKGVVVGAQMPKHCFTPTRCAQEMSKGIFDRPFGEPAVKKIAL